ncbi:MAG: hypothetical protein F6K30_19605 [Cyanothece sp. SIO2G6]|nr:hypothetical protein [Cyanothece sp. SIO2G6]
MVTVIAPGCHVSALTDSFVLGLPQLPTELWIPPKDSYWPAYSPQHLRLRLQQWLAAGPMGHVRAPLDHALLFIGFSAGVVASIGVARWWQAQGGIVKACIAVDGWGVPLYGQFPIHRISHDRWTHASSQLLGGTEVSFYADPGVEHLELWRSPHTTVGVSTAARPQFQPFTSVPRSQPSDQRGDRALQLAGTQITTAQFIHHLLQWYGEIV